MNASPLIGLANVAGLAWLPQLFGRTLITPTVRSEVLTGLGRPGEPQIALAIRRREIGVLRRDSPGPALRELNEGEASTIRAALKRGPHALVILDEMAARRVARSIGLRCTGTVGVIVEAKRAGLVKKVRPLFDQLADAGFYLAPELVAAVLADVGER